MTELEERHLKLVHAVNNSKTRKNHDMWSYVLSGFIEGVRACRCGALHLIKHADEVQRARGVNRPMNGGVWLDWKPQADIDNSNDTKGGA